MVIFGNRERKPFPFTVLQGKAMESFHDVPAIVPASFDPLRLSIDLLVFVLPDICDKEIAGLPVKGEPPGIPEANCPYLRPEGLIVHKRIVCRDRVWFP